eukprot:g8469.t1
MSPEFYRLMGMRSPPERGVYLQHLHGFLERRFGKNLPAAQRDLIFEHQGLAQTRPWRDEEYPEIAAWLAANQIPLKLIVAGSKRSEYFSPMVVPEGKKKTSGLMNVLLPAVQGNRTAARMLTARAMRHVKAGNADAAWDDLIACHRIGRLVGRGPTLVEGLVGYSIGGIAAEATATFLGECRMTPNQLVRFQKEFNALPSIPSMAEKINYCERIMFLDSVILLAYGGPGSFQRLFGFGGAGAAGPQPPRVDFARIDWDAILKTGNRWYDRLYAALAKPDRAARKAALRQVEGEIRSLAMQARNAGKPKNARDAGEQIGRLLISHFAPSLTAARTAEERYRQRSRLTRVGLALAAYRLDQGRYPQRLAQLSPKIRGEFQLASVGALSFAFVAQSLPTSLSQAVFGYVRDRRRTAWLMWVGPIVGVAGMAAIGIVDGAMMFAILLLIGGVGIGAFHPEAAVAAGRALPEHRTRALSVFMLGGAMGLGLGPTLSGAIVRQWGLEGLVMLIPFIAVLVGVLWWVGRLGTLSPPPRDGAGSITISQMFEGRGRLALAIFLICSLRLVPNMATQKVVSFALAKKDYDVFEIGVYQSLFLVAASAGMFVMAFRFRSGWERRFMIWCPILGIPTLMVLGWEGCPMWLFVTMLMVGGIVLWGTTPAMVSYAQQQFPNGAGLASAITMGLAWGLGGLIQAPITAAFSRTDSPQTAFYCFIPCLLLAALGASRLPENPSAETEPIPETQTTPDAEPAAVS